jgi:hypothetical protein
MTDDIHVDPRLVFLARASARLALVEAGKMDIATAYDELIASVCDCQRWPLAEQWERTHLPCRKRVDPRIERARRLLADDISFDRAYAEFARGCR